MNRRSFVAGLMAVISSVTSIFASNRKSSSQPEWLTSLKLLSGEREFDYHIDRHMNSKNELVCESIHIHYEIPEERDFNAQDLKEWARNHLPLPDGLHRGNPIVTCHSSPSLDDDGTEFWHVNIEHCCGKSKMWVEIFTAEPEPVVDAAYVAKKIREVVGWNSVTWMSVNEQFDRKNRCIHISGTVGWAPSLKDSIERKMKEIPVKDWMVRDERKVADCLNAGKPALYFEFFVSSRHRLMFTDISKN